MLPASPPPEPPMNWTYALLALVAGALLPRGRDLGLPIVQTGGNGRHPSGG